MGFTPVRRSRPSWTQPSTKRGGWKPCHQLENMSRHMEALCLPSGRSGRRERSVVLPSSIRLRSRMRRCSSNFCKSTCVSNLIKRGGQLVSSECLSHLSKSVGADAGIAPVRRQLGPGFKSLSLFAAVDVSGLTEDLVIVGLCNV